MQIAKIFMQSRQLLFSTSCKKLPAKTATEATKWTYSVVLISIMTGMLKSVCELGRISAGQGRWARKVSALCKMVSWKLKRAYEIALCVCDSGHVLVDVYFFVRSGSPFSIIIPF